ncbi:MAG: hypothetical protein AAFR65_06895 [Pseudomonadota bacterium]
MTDVSALVTQVAGALTSSTGTAVLAAGFVLAIGFGVFIFRDEIPLFQRRDKAPKLPLVEPPRLLHPSERTDREKFWDEGKGRFFTTGFQVLGLVAVAAVVVVLFGGRDVDSRSAGLTGSGTGGSEQASQGTPGVPSSTGEVQPNGYQSPFCEADGSLEEGFVEFCAGGSAVRMEIVRLRFQDRFVVEPLWIEKTCASDGTAEDCASDNALSLVSSESHAVPFAMGAVTSFDAPLLERVGDYDGLFVVGSATKGLPAPIAEARRQSLYRFAEHQVCGFDGLDCDRAQRTVFSTTASFSPPNCSADPRTIPAHFQNFCSRTNALKELQDSNRHADDEHLGPELLVFGIEVDPLAPSREVELHNAAACFLELYQGQLNISTTSKMLGGGAALNGKRKKVPCQGPATLAQGVSQG